MFPSVLEEVDPGLDLRSHATGGKLSRSQVLLRLRDREPVQEPLGGLPEIQRDLGHVRRDHEVRPPDRAGQGRGCQILVDHGLAADELPVSTDDRDAPATRGDDEPAVAVRNEPTDLLRFDDLDRPGGRDDSAPAPSLVVHHLPAFRFLHDNLVLSGVVRPDWLRRVRERGIIRADEDLGDHAGDTALDPPDGKFVPQGLREQVADLGLALRPAHVERHRGDDVARLFVLQQDVADLRTVTVRQDDVVAFLQEVGEARARLLDSTALGRRVTATGRQNRIAANGHDELRHATPSRGRPHYFDQSIRRFGRGSEPRERSFQGSGIPIYQAPASPRPVTREELLVSLRRWFQKFRATVWFRITYLVLLGIIVAELYILTLSPLACLVILLMPVSTFVVPYWLGERKLKRFAENLVVVFLTAIVLAAAT